MLRSNMRKALQEKTVAETMPAKYQVLIRREGRSKAKLLVARVRHKLNAKWFQEKTFSKMKSNDLIKAFSFEIQR